MIVRAALVALVVLAALGCKPPRPKLPDGPPPEYEPGRIHPAASASPAPAGSGAKPAGGLPPADD